MTATTTRQNIFPARNLSPESQAWAAMVEKRLLSVESGVHSTSQKTTAWAPAIGEIASLRNEVSDAVALGMAASSKTDDTVTWSESRPLSPKDDGSVENPDIPSNPDSTWFVYEGSKENVKEVWRWVPPTFEDGDVQGEWAQQKWGTDTLGEGAVDLKNLSASLQGDLGAVAGLEGRLQASEQAYQAFKTEVNQSLQDLQGLVSGATGKVIVSPTEPQGADRAAGNLWINTANGGSSPYAYDEVAGQWFPVTDPKAVEAAAAAVAATQKAQEALDRVQAQEDLVTAATLAATNAQKTADGKNSIFYTAEKPTLADRKAGDLWFDTDDGYEMYSYDPVAQDFIKVTPVADVDIKEIADKFKASYGAIIASPYPPDDGVVGTSMWRAPDGKIFVKQS